jgi:signal recognition particle subunit SRP54
MLEIISQGFKSAQEALTGKIALTETNVDDAMREIRVSLLEADVELGVVRRFLERVKARALGEVVQTQALKGKHKLKSTPGEHFVLICQNELEALMGPVQKSPIAYQRPCTIIMMVGLQGTGKTTTCGKMAHYLRQRKRKPLLVAADIYRPAAVEQLKIVGEQVGAPVYAQEGLAPPQLCKDALREAKRRKCDVVIFDTAGRLAVDDVLMEELEEIKSLTQPHEVFLVCDAMAGQDTVQTASEFNRRLDLSGFIMTKLDGDARGGAALSIKEITGKPIKFLGVGEGFGQLEEFRPEGLASRILGMGDIVGLMKDFEAVVDEKQAEEDTKKLLKGQFTLDDFLTQIKTLQKMGSVKDIFDKFPIPGVGGPGTAAPQIDESMFKQMQSMIQSMTPAERQRPQIINQSRAQRIARGSGRKAAQVKDLVQRFGMMQQMMGAMVAQPGLLGQLPGFKQLSQIRGMKGQDIDDLLGSPGKALKGFKGMPPGAGQAMPPLAPDMTPEQYQAALQQSAAMGAEPQQGVRQVSPKAKQLAKSKRKASRKARKKSRR